MGYHTFACSRTDSHLSHIDVSQQGSFTAFTATRLQRPQRSFAGISSGRRVLCGSVSAHLTESRWASTWRDRARPRSVLRPWRRRWWLWCMQVVLVCMLARRVMRGEAQS